jgi:hypothetical protein
MVSMKKITVMALSTLIFLSGAADQTVKPKAQKQPQKFRQLLQKQAA